MKRIVVIALSLSLLLVFGSVHESFAASSANFDFIRFAKEKVLKDFHPTANPSKAVAEFTEKPFEKEAGIIRARVHMYYSGWIRKHEMLVEMDLKLSDSTIKVAVLNDSNGMNLIGNSTFKEGQWVSLSSLGWN